VIFLIARVIIPAYNDHLRLLSPEPLAINKPSLLESKEPALLCNHVVLESLDTSGSYARITSRI